MDAGLWAERYAPVLEAAPAVESLSMMLGIDYFDV